MRKTTVAPGDVYGSLEVIERVGTSPRGAALFRCKCRLCGAEAIKTGYRLTDREHPITDCGCKRTHRNRDITGETHGAIIVVERIENTKNGDKQYKIKCALCGRVRAMSKNQILTNPKSCGCEWHAHERMSEMSPAGVAASIVDGVNVNSVFKTEATKSSQTGVRGVFPERKKGILTGTYRAAVTVRGETVIKTGFASVDSAKKWRDKTQAELIVKHGVKRRE